MPQSRLNNISIVFLVVGMIMFMVLGGIPAIYTFIVSTREYMVLHGISGSPYVGLAYYRNLTGLDVFPSLIVSSLILSLVPSVLAIIIAIPSAGMVGGMVAGRNRSLATIALLLPAFVPDIVLAFLVMSVAPAATLANPASLRVILILHAAVRPAAICAFIGACSAGLFKDRGQSILAGAGAGVFVGIAINLVRFLSGNSELYMLYMFHNPLLSSVGETFDTFIFLHGMTFFQISLSSAAWAVRTLPQMLMAVLIAIVVFMCIRSVLRDSQGYGYSGEFGTQATGLVPGLIGIVVLVAGLLLPLRFSTAGTMGALLGPIGNSAIITVLSVIVFGVLMFMLTAWLCVNINSVGTLIFVLVLAAIVNNTMGEFLFLRNIGLVNTYYAVALVSAFNIAFVLPLAYLAKLRNPNFASISSLVRAMLPYFIVFLGFFIAYTWGSSFNQVVYIHQQNYFGVSMLFQMAVAHSAGGGPAPPVGVVLWVTMPVLAIALITGLVFVMTDRMTEWKENA